jgi:hypothetical protein
MKKQNDKQPKRVVPVFATEAEEADWWYKHRNTHGKQLLDAVKNGEAQVLTKERLRERIAASKRRRHQWWRYEFPRQIWLWPESKLNRRVCLIRPTSNRCCTKHSQSEKSERRGGRRAGLRDDAKWI